MNIKKNSDTLTESYSRVISLLEKNFRYVDALEIDKETIDNYRQVIAYLRHRSPAEIQKILSAGSSRKIKLTRDAFGHDFTDEHIARLDSEKINDLLSSDITSRSFLERLATVRFGVTKGALSTLRSRNSLKEKIENLLAHESTHKVISKAASGPIADSEKPKKN